MQDENAHLNGGTGSDSASEVAESGPDDDEGDDAELSDEQDEEVDDAYMQQLAREARKLKVLLSVAFGMLTFQQLCMKDMSAALLALSSVAGSM